MAARACLSRNQKARHYSHVQQIGVIRQALKASPWPVEMSNAKRSQVRCSFGPPLPSGYESTSEMFDVSLSSRLNFVEAGEQLSSTLPDGFDVVSVKSIPRFFPSLEECSNVAFYRIQTSALEGTKSKWEHFWHQETFLVEKKKADKTVQLDARPMVREWSLEKDTLHLQLRFGPGRTLKPEKIVQAVCGFEDSLIDINAETSQLKICRTKLCFEKQNKDLFEI